MIRGRPTISLLLASFPALALGSGNDGGIEARLAKLEEIIKFQQTQMQRQGAKLHELELEKQLGLPQERRLNPELNVTALQDDLSAFKLSIKADIESVNGTVRDATGTDTDMQAAMNHIYLILCGALVMFMQAGFAMVEAGCCRAKNAQNILLKNLTDVCFGTLGWWAVGCAIAYGNPDEDGDGLMDNKFMGTEGWFGMGYLETDADGKQTPAGGKMLNWFFQWAFCSAAATIVSGGVAERVKFPGYVIYSLLMTAFIYPVVVAWTWGYGWLADLNDSGFMDFAGSGIVHMTGGVGALVGAICAGPRKNRWVNPDEFVPHNLPLVVLGTFILWFGWYGFNCGSTLGLSSESTGEMAAQVAMNTTIAAATGGLVVFLLRVAILRGYYDIGGFCNGILAGLVSITAGCGNVDSGSACIIAIIGGIIYQVTSIALKKLRIDDPIDAFAVHGAGGAWGVMAAAFFDWGKGMNYAHGWSGFDCGRGDDGKCIEGLNGQLIVANLVEVIAICAWVGINSALVFIPLRLAGFLRADDEVQDVGMDAAKHSPSKAYTIDPKTVNTAPRVSLQVLGGDHQQSAPSLLSPKNSQQSPKKQATDAPAKSNAAADFDI